MNNVMLRLLVGSDMLTDKKFWVFGGEAAAIEDLIRQGCTIINDNLNYRGMIDADICVMPPRERVNEFVATDHEEFGKLIHAYPHILQMEFSEVMDRIDLQKKYKFVTYQSYGINWVKQQKVFVFSGSKPLKDALISRGYEVVNPGIEPDYAQEELIAYLEKATLVCIGSSTYAWSPLISSQFDYITEQVQDNRVIEADLNETVKMISFDPNWSYNNSGVTANGRKFQSLEHLFMYYAYEIEEGETGKSDLNALLNANSSMS